MWLKQFVIGLIFIICQKNSLVVAIERNLPEETQNVRYDPNLSKRIAQNVMNFAHDLGVAIDTNKFPNTQIFSPLSIMSALAQLHMGSKGTTHSQLNKIFSNFNRYPQSARIHEEFGWLLEDVMSNENEKKRPRLKPKWKSTPFNVNQLGKGGKSTPNEHTVKVANGLFIQNGYSLRPEYVAAAQSVYKSEIASLNFTRKRQQSKDYINNWVSESTMGRIPSIIENGSGLDASIVLATTLYFKGFWEQPFMAAGTVNSSFFPDGPDSEPVRVLMMSLGGVFPFYDSKENNCRIIGLPYKGNQTTMYIIQPNDSTRPTLQQLQKTLTGEKINEMISKMKHETGVIAFPKFHVTNSLNLKEALTQMGVNDIFSDGSADFSLIADDDQITNENIAADSSLVPAFSKTPPSIQRSPPKQDLDLNYGEVMRPLNVQNFKVQESQNSNVQGPLDRFNETPLIFSRFGGLDYDNDPTPQRGEKHLIRNNNQNFECKTKVVEEQFSTSSTKRRRHQTSKRSVDSTLSSLQSLQQLDKLRVTPFVKKSQLYVDDILHKVDFNVNEQGTEAAAATSTSLRRSSTNVAFRCDTPFLILVRHDPTELPLFYGVVNIPL